MILTKDEKQQLVDKYEHDIEGFMESVGITLEDIIDAFDYDVDKAIEEGELDLE